MRPPASGSTVNTTLSLYIRFKEANFLLFKDGSGEYHFPKARRDSENNRAVLNKDMQKIQSQNQLLQEENNLLKVKNEILVDMVAESLSEFKLDLARRKKHP